MIFYKIEESLSPCDFDENYNGEIVCIISSKELKEKLKRKEISEINVPNYKTAQCCQCKVHPNALSACFSIISKDKKMERKNFGFILTQKQLMFIDSGETVSTYIKRMKKNKFHGKINIGRFIYDFLETIIDSDLRYLEEIGDRLVKLESAVIKGLFKEFNHMMLYLKKEVLLFSRYYMQLIDFGEELQENENGFFSETDIKFFEQFTRRATQLHDEAQFLREVSNQLRDVYHSQIDLKQSKTMNVLTVVTTIFTPLSIGTAWFGMNFKYMPELNSEYGYWIFIIINMVILCCSWWYLRKKQFL